MESRYCKFCGCEHPLTAEFWYRLEGSPRCKKQVQAKTAKHHAENQEKHREQMKAWRTNNAEAHSENNRKWREQNAERHRSNARAWYMAHKEQVAQRRKHYDANRERLDPEYKIGRRLRSRLYHAITGKNKHVSAVDDMGCSLEVLMQWLESQFTTGMSWDNYGAWHIDHVRPLASFDLTDPTQQQQAVHYTNLQPLWAEDNLSKWCKY